MSARRLSSAFALLCCLAPAWGAAQGSDGGTQAVPAWRSLLAALAQDSLRRRPVGSVAHAQSVALIRGELRTLVASAARRVRVEEQVVPFVTITIDSARSRIVSESLVLGADYVPLSGFGFEPLDVTDAEARFFAPARQAQPSHAGADRTQRFLPVPVLLAPARADGEPEYQPHALAAQLDEWKRAPALLVVTRDLMPRAMVARLLSPRLVLPPPAGGPDTPRASRAPVAVAITRAVAGHLIGRGQDHHRGSVRVIFRRDSLPNRAHNVMAIIEGADPAVRDEYVVLVAHMDTHDVRSEKGLAASDADEHSARSGAARPAALLAIAEQLVSAKSQLRRSVVLLWTSGHERGQLGFEHFLRSGAIEPTSIAAVVAIDALGHDASDLQTPSARLLATSMHGDWRALAAAIPSVPIARAAGPVSGDPYSADGCHGVPGQSALRGLPALALHQAANDAAAKQPVARSSGMTDAASGVTLVERASQFVQAIANLEGRVRVAPIPRVASCAP